MVVAGKLGLPPVDAKAFFPFAKAQAEKLTIAHAGVGSNAHLCAVLMSQALGAKFAQVAYRGTGPAMNDLVAGQVDVLCDQSTTAVPQIQGDKIRAYAVTSTGRLDVLPSTPTVREAGTDLEMTIWHGFYAPKGTPEPALDKLNAALGQPEGQDRARPLQIGRNQRLPGSGMDPRGACQALQRRDREMGRLAQGRRHNAAERQLIASHTRRSPEAAARATGASCQAMS
jgi:hypothetical protein